MKKIVLLLTAVALAMLSSAQQSAPPVHRQLPAKRTTKTVKIDGKIDDEAWKDASLITDMIEFRPVYQRAENPANKTVAYLMYDNEGVYFGGYCYEGSKDSIASELSGRDGFGNNDFVGIIFDTYKDNLNGFEYFITPLGEQWDAKSSNGGNEDFSWNAVWKSAAVIHNDGWSFEFFIPYSGIRFGKKAVQDWGLNVTRKRVKSGQQYMWNPVDPNVNGFLTQEGYWTGLTNIKPPVRLQFSPYLSVYGNHFPSANGSSNWTGQVNGGMDVKYGLNQAFTLDATLIPDFGQVQSDNLVLNLGPFAVQYNENRPFFTEGTELFSKGNLFYSRRIGLEPNYHEGTNLGANEQYIKEAGYGSKLLNATKISGRTQKGLGIGFLNAITESNSSIIEDVVTKETRRVESEPLTNYNIFVLDQTMKHNSSVSFVNTNVWRSGSAYDANVMAALFDLNDKKNTWNFGGKLATSSLLNYLPGGNTLTGYTHSFYFGKTSGRFNFNIWQDLTDTKFNNSDLGYFTNNNYLTHGGWAGYTWNKPKGIYNRIRLNFNFWYNRLLSKIAPIDKMFQDGGFNINGNMQTKKLWFFGAWMGYNLASNDFYEPRKEGRFFRRGQSFGMEVWGSSNEAKKYYVSIDVFHRRSVNFYGANYVSAFFYHRMRFSNKVSLDHTLNYNPSFNNIGFTDFDGSDNSIFARRKINTITNTLGFKYSFTNKMGLTFRARHYVSVVDNKEFFTLRSDGLLDKNTSFNTNRNQNFNLFNIDMVYTWQFAPGSFVYLVWKNKIEDFTRNVENNYFKNFGRTMEADQNNNFSMRIIYFIDYLQLKKHKKHA